MLVCLHICVQALHIPLLLVCLPLCVCVCVSRCLLCLPWYVCALCLSACLPGRCDLRAISHPSVWSFAWMLHIVYPTSMCPLLVGKNALLHQKWDTIIFHRGICLMLSRLQRVRPLQHTLLTSYFSHDFMSTCHLTCASLHFTFYIPVEVERLG